MLFRSITANQPSLPSLVLPIGRPLQPSSHSSGQFCKQLHRTHPNQPTARSFGPTSLSYRSRKNISPPVVPPYPQHHRRTKISIAFLPHRPPAAPQAHYLPTRFRALALFGRRLPERVVSSSLPASENLHITGREQMQQTAHSFDLLVGDEQ